MLGRAPVTAVGTGSDRCWDRVVFTLPGPAAGYSVAYVDTVEQDGSGDVLPVPGGAKLRVQLHHPAYDDNCVATLTPPVRPGRPLARRYPRPRRVTPGGQEGAKDWRQAGRRWNAELHEARR
ncbi:hypothetical protein GCM10009609_33660 [Pseudonocardia aurantiaca]|uniref:AMIN-like domain-containing protein n=1 Tax=Pseudonocardia aurantiaca TaxID=75290 RepID=A0ABW4FQA1_9PSEU